MEYPKLKNNPILESVAEIRFVSSFPDDIVVALIFKSLSASPYFKTFAQIPQPIMQMPAQIRSVDSNLRFQPYYILTKDNFSIGIGSHILQFFCRKPYVSFKDFEIFIKSGIDLLEDSLLNEVNQLILRYVNKIDDSLFDATDFSLQCASNFVKNTNKININVENNIDENTRIILNLNNLSANVTINDNGKTEKFENVSIINVAAVHNAKKISSFKDKSIYEIFAKLHDNTHEVFFKLLKADYVKRHFNNSFAED